MRKKPSVPERNRLFIHSMEKGLSVLSMFSAQKSSLSLSEIANANHWTPATANRYLFTLKELGFLVKDPDTKKYQLTLKVLDLGFAVLKTLDLRSRVLPYMIQIVRDLNVTVSCAVLTDDEIIYIERIRSSEFVHFDLNVGSRLPAYCTAAGRAILAFMEGNESRKAMRRIKFVHHTPYTTTDKDTLWRELELTKQRGYAISNQELTLGFKTLAAPVFKEGQTVEAAISISFPLQRVEGNNLEKLFIEKLLEISKRASVSI